jgi:hypothetical protein
MKSGTCVAFLSTSIVLSAASPSNAQQHLNCATWLQMSSADRVASAKGGTEGSLAAVSAIVDTLPEQDRAPLLESLRGCLSSVEPKVVDNLDSLCARDPSSGYPAFRDVINKTTQQCSHDAAAIFLK